MTATPLAPSSAEIRLARRRLGLYQPQFAELLGVSVSAVQQWEAGSHRPAAYLRLALERVGGLRAVVQITKEAA